jgi:hypothetical protein
MDDQCADNAAKLKIHTRILHLKNCAHAFNFNFLAQLHVTSGLTLCQAPNLLQAMLLPVLSWSLKILRLENAPGAVDNRLLTILRNKNVGLKALVVPLPGNTDPASGFTDDALIRYLQWKENESLELLNIEGHSSISSSIWQGHWACIKSIRAIKVRRTAITGIRGLREFEKTRLCAQFGSLGSRFVFKKPSDTIHIELDGDPQVESTGWAKVLVLHILPPNDDQEES